MMSDEKCPVDARERDQIWQEINTVKSTLQEVEKIAVAHGSELERLASRIDSVQSRMFDRIDHMNKNVDYLVNQVANDSAELRRREGRDAANKRWGAVIVGVLGLIIGTGGFMAFKPVESATIIKVPQVPEPAAVRVDRTID